MVPDGWQEVKLKDLACSQGNSFVIGPFGSDLVKSDYRDAGVPVVFVRDVTMGGFKWVSNVFVDYDKSVKLRAHSVKPEDIVITKMGMPPGIAAVYPNGAPSGIVTADIIRLRPSADKVVPSLLCEILNSYDVRHQVYKRTAGQTRPKLTLSDYKTITVRLPETREQQEIAKVLGAWDRAIDTCNQLVETSLRQKKALAQQLLTGKRRLPGFFTSKEVLHTSVGTLPKDWGVVSIGKVATEVSVRNADDEALPVLACSKHVGFVNSLEYFKKKVYSDDLTNYKVVRRGQFGFPSNHIEEGSIGLQNICDAGVVSPIYTVFEIDESRVDAGFLFKILKTDHYRQRFAAATNASVDRRGSLRWSGFKAIRIPLPSLKEQQAISAVLDQAAQLEEGYRQQREMLELEKSALMQQLLSGKRRVKLPSEHTTPAKEYAS
jgi:type I restriction enzyme S subunit